MDAAMPQLIFTCFDLAANGGRGANAANGAQDSPGGQDGGPAAAGGGRLGSV